VAAGCGEVRRYGCDVRSVAARGGRYCLGKRKDGKYAATVGGVVLSIPRQVGKTFLVGMVIITLCILFPGFTVCGRRIGSGRRR
jgi:hypothetical protein